MVRTMFHTFSCFIRSCADHNTDKKLQDTFKRMTDPNVYDKNVRPYPEPDSALQVYTRMYVYFLGNIDEQASEFFVQLLVRHRWSDLRLKYNTSDRCIEGEQWHTDQIWSPTTYLVNEKDAKIIDVSKANMFVSICPSGGVHFNYRLKTTLSCGMYLRNFPFDGPRCSVLLQSWLQSTDELVMSWEGDMPIATDLITLSEYTLTDISVKNSSFSFPEHFLFGGSEYHQPREPRNVTYSQLVLDFCMSREPGFYILDYYLPSAFLVTVSWVSFWLSPDAAPARVTLGTSTMLTFITLSNSVRNALPKVSYVKTVDVWFLICTTFIFFSLVEFAFVNTIHRRRKNVALKKVTTMGVLKCTLSPSTSRAHLAQRLANKSPQRPGQPTGTSNGITNRAFVLNEHPSSSPAPERRPTVFFLDPKMGPQQENHQLSDDQSPVQDGQLPEIKINVEDTSAPKVDARPRRSVVGNLIHGNRPFVEMTPAQIAKWIDTRSRWFFPVAFLVTNVVYWTGALL